MKSSKLSERRPAWGKCDRERQEFHHLAHHSVDVAAVFLELIEHPLFRGRATAANGRSLNHKELRCLAGLAFLHDIGKLTPGFQAKGWREELRLAQRGHLEGGWLWFGQLSSNSLGGAIEKLLRWPCAPRLEEWFAALFAHHGRPVAEPSAGTGRSAFPAGAVAGYDWRAEEAVMGRALLAWFPEIETSAAPHPSPPLLHFFCGLLTLADWIGSDRRAFPFEPGFREDYWQTARDRAVRRVAEIGLSPEVLDVTEN